LACSISRSVRSILFGRADAVVGNEGLRIGEVGRDAGGGGALRLVDARGDFEVEVEKLLEEVVLSGKALGGEDGRSSVFCVP
jgi:hypothetical protein